MKKDTKKRARRESKSDETRTRTRLLKEIGRASCRERV